MGFDFLDFLTNATGPTIISVCLIYIIFRMNMQHGEDRKVILNILADVQKSTLAVISENTAILKGTTTVLDARAPVFAAIEKSSSASVQLMTDVRAALRESIEVSTELKLLLQGLNGKAKRIGGKDGA